MPAKKKVSFKVLGANNAELRVITVEVEEGKKLKKRAEAEALKQIAEGEKIELIQEAVTPPPSKPETPTPGANGSDATVPAAPPVVLPPTPAEASNVKGKNKFTFEFETYKNGVMKEVKEISAVNDEEGAALEAVVEELKAALSPDESYRYTGKFRRTAIAA